MIFYYTQLKSLVFCKTFNCLYSCTKYSIAGLKTDYKCVKKNLKSRLTFQLYLLKKKYIISTCK